MPIELPGMVSFLLSMTTLALIYSLLALGLNIHYGYTGLLNFGHVAFFAAGAYTAAIVTIPSPGTVSGGADYAVGLGVPMPFGVVISLGASALVGGILALLIGLTSVRLGNDYLAIATFALAGIFEEFIRNEAWLTRGVTGLNNVPKPGRSALGADLWGLVYMLFVAAIVVGTYFTIERLLNSPFGRLLKGIREDEQAARMLGKSTPQIKLKSFAIGGGIAGIAGAVYAHYIGSVVAGQFIPLVTFLVWVAVLLGGLASNRGVILGAFVLVAFREVTRFLPEIEGFPTLVPSLRFAIIGLLLVLVIRFKPEGLLGNPDELVTTEDDT